MTAKLLSGKVFSDAIKAEVAAEVADIREVHGFSPCLVVVRVGEDPASAVYVGSKVRTAEELGIRSEQIHFAADASENEIIDAVRGLNARTDVDGILVQLPLPKHIDEQKVLELIDPEKDVDGFHPVNAGRLMQGQNALKPCTPAGVIEVLKRSGITIAGKNAVVVGRSNIVGRPVSILLNSNANPGNCTVTVCHSRTKDLAGICSQADIIVAALGIPGFLKADMVKEGAVVIDVGITRVPDPTKKSGFAIKGDVDFDAVAPKCSYITPVPGGVGLMTIAALLMNTLNACTQK